MMIYNVKRMIRRKRDGKYVFESKIFAFHPRLDPMLKVARELASRYKKRFVVCCNEYEDDELVGAAFIIAFDCKGKNSPVTYER